MKKILIPTLTLAVILFYFGAASAAPNTPSAPANTNVPSAPANKTPISPPTPVNQPLNIHLENPLAAGGVTTIPDAVNKILSVVIRIALPLIIIFFIWSGLTFIFARGKPDEVGRAKRIFLYTVIGTLLILGAWVITNAIVGTVDTIIK